jgi:hypothetical protein
MAYEKTAGLFGNIINGVDEGGPMSIALDEGYDELVESGPDGSEVAIVDRESQFVRGTVTTQDWDTVIALLSGTLGTYVFYERKSGVAAATGYIKHTITAPVIWDVSFNWQKGQCGTVTFKFECRFVTAADVISTVHAITDSQAAPSDILPDHGGYRVVTALHGALAIYALNSFSFHIGLKLAKACNDGWKGYGSVDAELIGGTTPDGSLSCQDSSVASSKIKSSQLLEAARASLVLTCKQSGGAANKVVTIAGVIFATASTQMSGDMARYAEMTANYRVSNSIALPLTLAGTNKIITIADAA